MYIVATLPCNLSLACFADINVSQGNVATHARCGGIFNIHFKECWSWVCGPTFWPTLYTSYCSTVASSGHVHFQCGCSQWVRELKFSSTVHMLWTSLNILETTRHEGAIYIVCRVRCVYLCLALSNIAYSRLRSSPVVSLNNSHHLYLYQAVPIKKQYKNDSFEWQHALFNDHLHLRECKTNEVKETGRRTDQLFTGENI